MVHPQRWNEWWFAENDGFFLSGISFLEKGPQALRFPGPGKTSGQHVLARKGPTNHLTPLPTHRAAPRPSATFPEAFGPYTVVKRQTKPFRRRFFFRNSQQNFPWIYVFFLLFVWFAVWSIYINLRILYSFWLATKTDGKYVESTCKVCGRSSP